MYVCIQTFISSDLNRSLLVFNFNVDDKVAYHSEKRLKHELKIKKEKK